MKKYKNIFIFLLAAIAVAPAHAQFIGYSSPQAVQQVAFNNVLPSPGAVFLTENIGQNIHFLTYSIATPGNMLAFDIVLQGSIDGTNFFDISEHSIATNTGALFAVGYFPKVQVLVKDFQTSGGSTLLASYVGTSSTAGPPLGAYSAAQNLTKSLWTELSAGASQSAILVSPTGSTSGYVTIFAANGGSLPGGSSLQVGAVLGNTTQNLLTGNLPTSLAVVVPIPDFRGQQVKVSFNSGGASATNISAYYFFIPPGAQSGLTSTEVQPLSWASNQMNTEQTSAANTAVTKSVAATNFARVHLFSVSARCSAGTAQLQVKDGVGGTVIWSTAATEVATTTFRYQWNPSLTSTFGNGMDIVLGACGAANTGTLDVQASQF
jgi:hypothetical protein